MGLLCGGDGVVVVLTLILRSRVAGYYINSEICSSVFGSCAVGWRHLKHISRFICYKNRSEKLLRNYSIHGIKRSSIFFDGLLHRLFGVLLSKYTVTELSLN